MWGKITNDNLFFQVKISHLLRRHIKNGYFSLCQLSMSLYAGFLPMNTLVINKKKYVVVEQSEYDRLLKKGSLNHRLFCGDYFVLRRKTPIFVA